MNLKTMILSLIAISLSNPAHAEPEATWTSNLDDYECAMIKKEWRCWGGNKATNLMEAVTCPLSKPLLDTLTGQSSPPCAKWYHTRKAAEQD